MKWALAAAIAALALIWGAEAAATGIYDACSGDECVEALARQRAGGFGRVLNYANGGDPVTYANQARAAGMRVVWNLAGANDLPRPDAMTIVAQTKDHPATWGYYVGDEVPLEKLGGVGALVTQIRAVTARPTMYVSRPRRELLDPFRVVADLTGVDTYPVGTRLDGYDPGVCKTMRRVRPELIVLQAFSWHIDYADLAPTWPTAWQMARMNRNAQRCGRGRTTVFWFCYHCVWDYHPDPERYWPKVVESSG